MEVIRRDTLTASSGSLPVSAGTVNILVVHDEPEIRALMSAMLKGGDYGCVLAGSAREALERIERDPPYDLIFSGMTASGLPLLEQLSQAQPEIPIVSLASACEESAALVSISHGAYDFLLQPFAKEQLLHTVKRAVEYRRLMQQNAAYRQNLDQLVTTRTEMLNRAVSDLERSYDTTLEALGDALDLKDAETEGHSKRVTAYTIALARGMGLPMPEIRVIARGAFLHDIGKMAIPDAILLKAGKLKPDEQKIMREHCARGYQMLRKIPFLQEVAEIVYSHQEHHDGTGYPRGLKSDQIHLGSRIFSVADTLDAITSDRPYRRARTFTAAREEIRRCAGTQFDPKVVESYLSLPDQLWEDLRQEIIQHAKRFSPFTFSPHKFFKNPFG